MASVLGNELLRALAHGERELELRRAAVKDDSVRAFTLLVRTYDDAQRAVGYLRWPHGDAHRIAPSLFDNGGGRPRPSKANSSAEPSEAVEEETTDPWDEGASVRGRHPVAAADDGE
jgi:hypothetical protein